jgi:hypothetical protein
MHELFTICIRLGTYYRLILQSGLLYTTAWYILSPSHREPPHQSDDVIDR